MRIQAWHVVVLLIVVLLVFGSNRLPDVARSVGQSLKIFKREISELREDAPPPQVPPAVTPPAATPPATAAGVPPVAPAPPEQPPTDDGKAPQA